MKYRPDIDGLRAIAVVSVIIFHAQKKFLTGGFIGVDIFFVISGYLITGMMLEKIEHGTFTLLNFYARRAKRILPALFVVIFFCLVFSWLWLVPNLFVDYAKSLIASTLFISNIYFWKEKGYFSNAAAEKPLLHTWSLSVEEQYYIFFPIIILIILKFKKNRLVFSILLILLASLMLNYVGGLKSNEGNFYLVFTRIWELLSGACAVKIGNSKLNRMSNTYSAIGLIGIFFSLIFFDRNAHFPNYAIIPVVSTLLILVYASPNTTVGKILENKLLVGIGIVSYSAYLWHQPLLAFARIYNHGELSIYFSALTVVLTFIVATVSWKFIETPFRRKDILSDKAILITALFVSLSYISIGVIIQQNEGFPTRLKFEPSGVISQAELKATADQWGFTAYPEPLNASIDEETGLKRIGFNSKSAVVLIGDSHSYQYWNTLDGFFQNKPPSENLKTVFLEPFEFLPTIEQLKLPSNTNTVVLSYFWSLRYGNKSVNQEIRCCGDGPNGTVGKKYLPQVSDDEINQKMDEIDGQLAQLIEGLGRKKIHVIIILDNPFGEELNAQSMLELNLLTIKPSILFKPLKVEDALERSEPVRKRLINIARAHHIDFIDPFQFLCNSTICPSMSVDGYMLYKDYDHISIEAAKKNANYILEILK